MKAFERVRDVLEHAEAFHREVSEFYGRLHDEVEKERAKMLLDYLRRHEANLGASLADYEEDAANRVLDTWFKYTLEEDPSDLLAQVVVDKDMTVDDVVAVALRLDDYLIALYRSMAEHSESSEVKEVFVNLLELEQQDQRQIARTGLRAHDL